jgi:hypothetical protein
MAFSGLGIDSRRRRQISETRMWADLLELTVELLDNELSLLRYRGARKSLDFICRALPNGVRGLHTPINVLTTVVRRTRSQRLPASRCEPLRHIEIGRSGSPYFMREPGTIGTILLRRRP